MENFSGPVVCKSCFFSLHAFFSTDISFCSPLLWLFFFKFQFLVYVWPFLDLGLDLFLVGRTRRRLLLYCKPFVMIFFFYVSNFFKKYGPYLDFLRFATLPMNGYSRSVCSVQYCQNCGSAVCVFQKRWCHWGTVILRLLVLLRVILTVSYWNRLKKWFTRSCLVCLWL